MSPADPTALLLRSPDLQAPSHHHPPHHRPQRDRSKMEGWGDNLNPPLTLLLKWVSLCRCGYGEIWRWGGCCHCGWWASWAFSGLSAEATGEWIRQRTQSLRGGESCWNWWALSLQFFLCALSNFLILIEHCNPVFSQVVIYYLVPALSLKHWMNCFQTGKREGFVLPVPFCIWKFDYLSINYLLCELFLPLQAPLNTPVTEDKMYILSEKGKIPVPIIPGTIHEVSIFCLGIRTLKMMPLWQVFQCTTMVITLWGLGI